MTPLVLLAAIALADPAGTADPADEPPPLQVEVIVPPKRPAARRDPREARAVPLGEGPVTVDGDLAEPVWQETLAAPDLLPLTTSRRPIPIALRAIASPEGLAFGLAPLPDGWTASLLVDPDGLQERWLIAEFGGEEGATWQECGSGPLEMPVLAPIRSTAAPCRAVSPGGQAAGGPGGWEVLFPWELLRDTTWEARVLMLAQGPDGAAGTLSDRGYLRPVPGHALPLLRNEEPRPTVRAAVLLDRGTHRITLDTRKAPEARGPWRCALRPVGREGPAVVLEPSDADPTPSAELPAPSLLFTAVSCLAVDADGPIRPAIGAVARYQRDVSLVTPVFGDALEVALDLSGKVRVPVEVASADGTVLGRAEVDLGYGASALRILAAPDWPEHVRLTVGGLLPAVDAWRREGR